MNRGDVGGVDQEGLEGDEEGGTESEPTGDDTDDFSLVLWKPGDRDEHSGEGDHGGGTGTDRAVGDGEGGDVGVQGEVGEEGGHGEQQTSKYQTATLTKDRDKDQAAFKEN